MEPMRGTTAFTHPDWSFDFVVAGYRCLVECAGRVRIRSRGGIDIGHWFPEVVRSLMAIGAAGHTVLDGLIVVPGASGCDDGAALHRRALRPGLRAGDPAAALVASDILAYRGTDVRARPWRERRSLLQTLAATSPALKLRPAMPARGEWTASQARSLGYSHILGHRRSAPYCAGPSRDLLLLPCQPA
jgi:ATP-dependent DNA ligase